MKIAFLGLSLASHDGPRARGPHCAADLSLTANADIPSRWALGYLRACARDPRECGKRAKTSRGLSDRQFVAADPDDIRWPQTPAATTMWGRTGGRHRAADNQALEKSSHEAAKFMLFFGANQPLRPASRSEPTGAASGLCRSKAYASRPWEGVGPLARSPPNAPPQRGMARRRGVSVQNAREERAGPSTEC